MTIPTKTALGNEELKSRTHRLGQRHRTVLFLVDGRRPLSEVLSLAQQAGAATAHFEDLLRLGMVEVPAEPEPPPPVVVPEDPPEAVTAMQLDVPQPPEAPQPPDVPTLTEVHVVPSDVPPVEELPEQPAAEAAPEVTAPAPPSGPVPVLLAEAEPPVVPPPPAAPPPPPQRSAPRDVPVLSEEATVDSLQQVRNLLIDTLRLDAPLFSARMFMRVRNARTTTELIDLTWEIQDHLTRARHAQRQLISLQRAREILGLGNTVVADDSTRPPLDD